jgi:hypothetical protein
LMVVPIALIFRLACIVELILLALLFGSSCIFALLLGFLILLLESFVVVVQSSCIIV